MSKTKLRSAIYSIDNIIRTMNIQSHTTRADTRVMLIKCIKDLHELGFKVGHIKGIKERQIKSLVSHWSEQKKSPATIKNYMAKLRKLNHYLGSPALISSKNCTYQINNRSYVPKINKAITGVDFTRCNNPYIRLSLEGQALFGLRREESLKFKLSEAHQGNELHIKSSWTKGGIGRVLKIRTTEQREWLNRVNRFIKPGESLIPKNKTYKEHLNTYQEETKNMGLNHCHGLRHAYAQRRYKELTAFFDELKVGLQSPINGGKPFKELSPIEREWDRRARHIIVRELGHSRISITNIYL